MPEFFKREKINIFGINNKIVEILENILEELREIKYLNLSNFYKIDLKNSSSSEDKFLDKILIEDVENVPDYIPQINLDSKSKFNSDNSDNSKILEFDINKIAKSMEINENENK